MGRWKGCQIQLISYKLTRVVLARSSGALDDICCVLDQWLRAIVGGDHTIQEDANSGFGTSRRVCLREPNLLYTYVRSEVNETALDEILADS